MKKVKKYILLFVLMHIMVSVAEIQYEEDYHLTAPIVPLNVITKGRSFVADYLSRQVVSATIEVSGDSVARTYSRSVDFSGDIKSGRVIVGSLASMNQRITDSGALEFSAVRMGGVYAITLSIKYMTVDGRVAFLGRQQHYTDNERSLNKTVVHYSINPTLAVSDIRGDTVTAKYVSTSGFGDQGGELTIGMIGNTTVAYLPKDFLDTTGSLVFLRGGFQDKLTAVNISTGEQSEGVKAFLSISRFYSGDIANLGTINTLSSDDLRFHLFGREYQNVIYGRIPPFDFVSSGIKESVDLSIPVYNIHGHEIRRINPKKVLIRRMDSQDFEEISPNEKGSYNVSLPEGSEYRLILEYGILDWEQSPYAGKG